MAKEKIVRLLKEKNITDARSIRHQNIDPSHIKYVGGLRTMVDCSKKLVQAVNDINIFQNAGKQRRKLHTQKNIL
ncbi:uncharacterized protein LOC129748953 isoform X2 [Uranotaenia lowii]|uniref:uncharacterized protein LOC129748953 isoform X2 n=1 Tax=Uranotaenia lowii TaxID=190385 RepID=UPI0024787986|nr:uncharacterized protein LOC129748953 isoform X2 [Uranotaenia lowii]